MRTVTLTWKDPDYDYRCGLTEEELERLRELNITEYISLEIDLDTGHVRLA